MTRNWKYEMTFVFLSYDIIIYFLNLLLVHSVMYNFFLELYFSEFRRFEESSSRKISVSKYFSHKKINIMETRKGEIVK